MDDKCNVTDIQVGYGLGKYLEEIKKKAIRCSGIGQNIFNEPTGETATEIAAQERRKALWSDVRFLGETNPFYSNRSDFREPSTESILRDIGGINMGRGNFVAPENIEKVIIRTKDGREFEGSVKRIEYIPGPYGKAGYSEVTASTLKQTSKDNYGIKEVIFNNPYTIVNWDDGTKTIVCCQDNYEETVKIVNGKEKKVHKHMKSDNFNPEIGFAMAIVKKHLGNMGNYNNIFHKYIPETKATENTEEKAD